MTLHLLLDGVTGIDQQVDEDLLQPVGVGADTGQIGGQLPHDVDAADLQLLAEDLGGAGQDVVDGNGVEPLVGLAAEFAHVVDDFARAVHVAVDLLGHGGQQVDRDGLVVSHFLDEEPTRRLDDGQRLIELVRDPGRHLPQGGHLAHLDELLLGLEPLGDVAGRHQQRPAAGVFHGRDPHVHVERGAVLADLLDLVDRGPVFDLRGQALALILREELGEVAVEDVQPLEAVNRVHGIVAIANFQGFPVQHEHRVGDAVENLVVFLLRTLEHFLELFEMRDVEIHFHGRHDLAGFVADRRGLHHPVGRGALLADPGLLAVVALPIGEGLLHRAVRAFGGAALVGREAEVARLRVEHLGELPVVGDQPVIPVLDRDDAGDHVEEALVLVPLAVQLDLLGADFAAHEIHGGGELAHFIPASDVHPRGIVPPGDRRSPGDQAPDRTVDEAHDEEKDDRGGHEEGGQGQADDPFFHEADFFFRLGECHHHVERAEDVLVGRVEMARAGRTPRLVVDRADDPQELLPVGS